MDYGLNHHLLYYIVSTVTPRTLAENENYFNNTVFFPVRDVLFKLIEKALKMISMRKLNLLGRKYKDRKNKLT